MNGILVFRNATNKVKISIRVNRQLFGAQSDFQLHDVFDRPNSDCLLTSDGSIIFSEKDEFTYDEMIVHVPMAVTRTSGVCWSRRR